MDISHVITSRRRFLEGAIAMLPAMHLGLHARVAVANSESPAFRLRRLQLAAPDLAAQRAFYEDVLELPIIAEEPESLVVQAGETLIEFVSAEKGDASFYHFAFNIPENKLDRAMEWMDGRCPLIRWHRTKKIVVDFKSWDAHAVYFFDPAGNIVEFIAHHSLPTASEGAFSSKDILYASEIGLVSPDVPALTAELEDAFGVTPFKGSSPTFTAVGTPEGLFILSKAGRVWLPTRDKKAIVCSLRAEISGVARESRTVGAGQYRIEVRS